MAKFTQTSPSVMRSKVGAALVTGAAGGLVTLIDPAKFPPALRRSLYLGTGALGGVAAWFGSGAAKGIKPKARARLVVALGLGGMLAAGTKVGFVLDSAIHRFLQRRGVAKPRVVMAVSGGVFAAAVTLVESAMQGDDAEAAPAVPAE